MSQDDDRRRKAGNYAQYLPDPVTPVPDQRQEIDLSGLLLEASLAVRGAKEDVADPGRVTARELRSALETGDVLPLFNNPLAIRGLANPGQHAGEIEGLMLQLPHAHRLALRRAAKAQATKSPISANRPPQRSGLPLIVEHGRTWWVYDGAIYVAVDRALAVVELARMHPDLETTVPTGESGRRYMNPVELYSAYGVTARKLRWTYNGGGARWDAEERVLDVPGARVRQGRAARSERCEEWLHRLTDRPDQLLDWLATAAQLDRPTSAVQIRGPGSIGKAMLAAALTTWLGGRCDYKHATSPFNAGLVHGPLVVLDEGVADSQPDRFRELTGNHEHEVCAKYRMPETLVGCPRTLVTSNEPDPLRLGREELSAHSEMALGRRMLVFDGQQAAGDYLEQIGGWATTRPWCEPDGELVAHLRWLAANRQVAPGRRFLVEGDAADWVANAHLRSGVAGDLVHAYLAYEDLVEDSRTYAVTDPQPFHFDPAHPEHVGVNVGGLQANWGRLVGDARAPTHQALSKALRRLSGQETPARLGRGSDRGPRVYLVPRAKLLGGC